MALKKKNVFQEFMQDDYVPSGEQQIVKYVMGKGNNLHEVETPSGSTFLVSMPKKYRQTVWLKRGDCIVIDPIVEGKKVLGEILCVIPSKSVVDLINSESWSPITNSNGIGSGDSITGVKIEKSALLSFFTSSGNRNTERNSSPTLPPSGSSSSCDEDTEEEDEEETPTPEVGCKVTNIEDKNENESLTPSITNQDHQEDGYKSRVQFLTSGIVTVTNVVNDITSLQNGLQSLDFETEDSSEETSLSRNQNELHRKAHTIRIQVNYPPGSTNGESTSDTAHVSQSNSDIPHSP